MAANEQISSDTPVDEVKPTKKLILNVAELRRRLGEQRTEPINVILPTTVVVQSRTTPTPVVGEVLIESIEGGLSVTGSVTSHSEADCRRCLEIVRRKQVIEIDEIFQVDAPADSDLIDFDGHQIDLLPIIRDAVVLSLPLAPLCMPSCVGPDPERYPAKVDGTESGGADARNGTVDPRWAALDGLNLSDG